MICDKPRQASYAPTWDKVTDALSAPRATLTSLDLPMIGMIRAMRRRSLPLLLLIAAAVAPVHAHTLEGRVVAIGDGDTITVLDVAGAQHRVRLVGIDAPELGQPGGYRSKDSLSRLVYEHDVRVEWIKKDQYGRLVGKVWVAPPDCPLCGTTLDAGLAQLTMGRAWWFRRFARDQTPEDRGRYEFAEQEARGRKAGLWGSGNPVPPWEWRRPRQ